MSQNTITVTIATEYASGGRESCAPSLLAHLKRKAKRYGLQPKPPAN